MPLPVVAVLVALALGVIVDPAAADISDVPIAPTARMAAVGAPCPGAGLRADRVIEGSFGTSEQGSYVMVPFDVPSGVTAVRVKYCFDQPETPLSSQNKHTLDLGLWAPGSEFRGWGGSSHPDVTVSPEGFSSEEDYLRDPRGHVPGRTTRGFIPGAVRAGRWEVELGVGSVVPRSGGDIDGRVAWRVEIELSRDPAHADEPYRPAPYDASPARRGPGWYAGDTHVHAEHSSLGDATMREVFDYAFGEAKLDFITLTDYVTSSGWGEIGRHQGRYPGRLITRSAEVITYRGHTHNHMTGRYLDHRFGPVLVRRDDGSLAQRRAARAPRELFDEIHASGGLTQVTHPTIFPSEVFGGFCRGCPWDYSDDETRWERVDAYEVHTGPPGTPEPAGNELGPNPFTPLAIEEFDRLRRLGHRVAAVASSDSHNAGRTSNPVTQAPIGIGTTVVHMRELSERGLVEGVQAGHTYVKVFGAASPDLRLEARNARGTAIMGDGLPGDRATLTARVIGGVATAQPRVLQVLRDGRVVDAVPVTGGDFRREVTVSGRGDYRLQVMRGSAVDALTTPIALGIERRGSSGGSSGGSGPGGSGSRPRGRRSLPRLRLSVSPLKVRTGRRTRFRVRVTSAGRPVRGALVRLGDRRARTNRAGRATLRLRIRRPGRRLVAASRRGHLAATAPVRVLGRAARPPARR